MRTRCGTRSWRSGVNTTERMNSFVDYASLDAADPDGALGVDARLAVWFSLSEPRDGRLVDESDPLLAGLPDDLRARLAEIVGPER